MPFGKRRKGGKVEVINKETGRVLGKHPNDKAANKQLAALAINVPEAFDNPYRRKPKR